MDKKKLLSFLSAVVMLVSGAKYAKGESTPTVPPTNPTDISETQLSKAEELFGWKDTGDTYYLSNASIARVLVDGVEKKYFAVEILYP